MKTHKEYPTIDDEEVLKTAEPAVAYEDESPTLEEFLASIPEDLMRQVIRQANEECCAGKCTPHEQMEEWINTRMGW